MTPPRRNAPEPGAQAEDRRRGELLRDRASDRALSSSAPYRAPPQERQTREPATTSGSPRSIRPAAITSTRSSARTSRDRTQATALPPRATSSPPPRLLLTGASSVRKPMYNRLLALLLVLPLAACDAFSSPTEPEMTTSSPDTPSGEDLATCFTLIGSIRRTGCYQGSSQCRQSVTVQNSCSREYQVTLRAWVESNGRIVNTTTCGFVGGSAPYKYTSSSLRPSESETLEVCHSVPNGATSSHAGWRVCASCTSGNHGGSYSNCCY